jgi:hypothetical protein
LLEIHYVGIALGAADANVCLKVRWTGLSQRRLISRGKPNRILSGVAYAALQNSHAAESIVSLSRISDNLPEIVFQLLEPLYQLFDFWRLPQKLVQDELLDLKRYTFPY